MAQSFSSLTQAGTIGKMALKNRMVVTAMGVNLAEADGSCGDRILAFHERQAAGGVGLIVLGVAGVAWPSGGNQPRQIAISDDRFIPGLRALAEAVHKHGTKLVTQLHHGGVVAAQDSREGRPLWVPSYPDFKAGDLFDGFLEEELAAFHQPDAPTPQLHVMTEADIKLLVEQFAAAAVRAQQAGLDGVEIHAGHGYLISEFLSPLANQRDDAYGGSLVNRARLLTEILQAVRAAVGPDFAMWCKIDCGEFGASEGISLADAQETAKLAEAAGADAITVSAYHDSSRGALHSESNIPHTPNRLVESAAAIRAGLSVPVITSGRIEPADANRHIAQGKYDFLGMGRKMLADPDLPAKIIAGSVEQIRPCVYCYCCVSQIYVLRPVKCAVNPEAAHERERALISSDQSRHYVVIGGGPGGMEVARRLDLRGHRVTLLERSGRLGGTLQFASIAYEPNGRLLRWLKLQLQQSSVTVRLNTEATVESVRQLQPDAVIVATGAARPLPPISGADQAFVFSGDEMRALVLAEQQPGLERKTDAVTRVLTRLGAATGLTAVPAVVRQASKLWLPLGQRIVIIGAELVGLELAEFLAERGRQVTVIDAAPRPGKGLYLVRRLRLLAELRHLGVTLLNRASDIHIGDHSVSYSNYRGQTRQLEADHVIVAQGASADIALAEKLQQAGLSVHCIGDCTGVSYIEGAMESAAELAVTL